MAVPVFYGEEEDAYWWILCLEKFFNEHETPKSLKVLKAVGALRGSAFTWWIGWCRVHPRYNWDTFTIALLWRFKPEWRPILPLDDEEEEPTSESTEDVEGASDLSGKSSKGETLGGISKETKEETEEIEEQSIVGESAVEKILKKPCVNMPLLYNNDEFTISPIPPKPPDSLPLRVSNATIFQPKQLDSISKEMQRVPKPSSTTVKLPSPLILYDSPQIETKFRVLHPPQAPPPKPPYFSFEHDISVMPPQPSPKTLSFTNLKCLGQV
ncbi:uncharacterized protein LOC131624597 isoform X1 [Vicia villosa]|uniref:uncharacterized protein LOC131624597 isoform X1 n=1 Tax=Vicia villosa TaxID=3911 RepID=UPI00273B6901|nr:uncharacterized protein LOC131624597 isoform X1 [Vicia villosa]